MRCCWFAFHSQDARARAPSVRTPNRLNRACAQHTLHTSKQKFRREICAVSSGSLLVLGFCATSTDTIHWETKQKCTETDKWNIIFRFIRRRGKFSTWPRGSLMLPFVPPPPPTRSVWRFCCSSTEPLGLWLGVSAVPYAPILIDIFQRFLYSNRCFACNSNLFGRMEIGIAESHGNRLSRLEIINTYTLTFMADPKLELLT